jgi:hypothetical protein
LAVGGFVCGLLGLLFCWIPVFGVILALVGVSLSGAGMSAAKRMHASNGLAIAGLVCGIIGVLLGLWVSIFVATYTG